MAAMRERGIDLAQQSFMQCRSISEGFGSRINVDKEGDIRAIEKSIFLAIVSRLGSRCQWENRLYMGHRPGEHVISDLRTVFAYDMDKHFVYGCKRKDTSGGDMWLLFIDFSSECALAGKSRKHLQDQILSTKPEEKRLLTRSENRSWILGRSQKYCPSCKWIDMFENEGGSLDSDLLPPRILRKERYYLYQK